MDGLKQAIQANTRTALERAIKNAESAAGFNPPELRTAKDMLEAKVVIICARVHGCVYVRVHVRAHDVLCVHACVRVRACVYL